MSNTQGILLGVVHQIPACPQRALLVAEVSAPWGTRAAPQTTTRLPPDSGRTRGPSFHPLKGCLLGRQPPATAVMLLRDPGLGSGSLCVHHDIGQVCSWLPSSPTSRLTSGLYQEVVQTVAIEGGTWALLRGSFSFQHLGRLASLWERCLAAGLREVPRCLGY